MYCPYLYLCFFTKMMFVYFACASANGGTLHSILSIACAFFNDYVLQSISDWMCSYIPTKESQKRQRCIATNTEKKNHVGKLSFTMKLIVAWVCVSASRQEIFLWVHQVFWYLSSLSFYVSGSLAFKSLNGPLIQVQLPTARLHEQLYRISFNLNITYEKNMIRG